MFFQSLSNVAMEKALSATWQRAGLISHNLTNEDTPNYKAKRLDFESALESEIQMLKKTQTREARQKKVDWLESSEPRVYEDESTITRADGNNVDANAEQIELARTALHYRALTQRINGYYSTLNYVITGGR